METVSYPSALRRQSKRNSFKHGLSTSDCILTLVYYFLRLLFKGFCTKNKKNIQRFSLIFCFPVVYLLRVVNTIKWRRILNAARLKKCFERIIIGPAFKTLKITKINGQLREENDWKIWKSSRKKDSSYVQSLSKMEFDVRNV